MALRVLWQTQRVRLIWSKCCVTAKNWGDTGSANALSGSNDAQHWQSKWHPNI